MNTGPLIRSKDSLVFERGEKVTMPLPIAEIMQWGGNTLIRLRVEPTDSLNENIYCFDRDGKKIWQIGHIDRVRAHSPFIGMEIVDDKLVAFAWCGAAGRFDLKTGQAMESWFSR